MQRTDELHLDFPFEGSQIRVISWLATASRLAACMLQPIQNYRPQLTSVVSIANRISGVVLSLCDIVLVIWLIAAAAGPEPYGVVQRALASWFGQAIRMHLRLFLHLCGGTRHLIWDMGFGYELRWIYASGWAVVAGSVALTLAAWIASLLLRD